MGTYAGRALEDENSLSTYDVAAASTVSLGLRMLGGKVHGSLARAGKVKGQYQRLKLKKRRNQKLVVPRDDSNTIHDSSMLSLSQDVDVGQTPMHNFSV